MNDLKLIQYLPLTHPRATLRFVKKLNNAGVMTILDLEDSAQDPFDIHKTRELKTTARERFLDLAKSVSWETQVFDNPIFIRINGSKTEYFKDDVSAILEVIRHGFPVSGIFLPMTETYDEILHLHYMLKGDSGETVNRSIEIVPMVETGRGMRNIEAILEDDRDKNLFSKVHYGHFDYCFDEGIWPFPDPNEKAFWDIVSPLVDLIGRHQKTYIHTPFPFPNDVNLFWSACRHISGLFPNYEIWGCTLNAELSVSKAGSDVPSLNPETLEMTNEYKRNEALAIEESFLSSRANRRSFGVSRDRFIPPHQYFGGQNYLKSLGEKNDDL